MLTLFTDNVATIPSNNKYNKIISLYSIKVFIEKNVLKTQDDPLRPLEPPCIFFFISSAPYNFDLLNPTAYEYIECDWALGCSIIGP